MLKNNKKIMVHAYKRNGWLYRVWEFPNIIEINENYICLSMFNSKIITSDKKSNRAFHSKTSKNLFWFFFPGKWFNIIANLVDDYVEYYVNIASPFIYEEDALKYYDFDLDVKMRSNSLVKYKVLDIDEFDENKISFKYEEKLQKEVQKSLDLFKNQSFRKKIFDLISVEKIKSLEALCLNNKNKK